MKWYLKLLNILYVPIIMSSENLKLIKYIKLIQDKLIKANTLGIQADQSVET